MIWDSSRISDPDFFSSRILGLKKAPDPGSATVLSGKAFPGLTNKIFLGLVLGRKGSFQDPQHCF
jgi:hypothetical protein